MASCLSYLNRRRHHHHLRALGLTQDPVFIENFEKPIQREYRKVLEDMGRFFIWMKKLCDLGGKFPEVRDSIATLDVQDVII